MVGAISFACSNVNARCQARIRSLFHALTQKALTIHRLMLHIDRGEPLEKAAIELVNNRRDVDGEG